MTPEPASPPPVPFTNRRNSLVVFGVLTMLSGLFCALLIGLAVVGQQAVARSGTPTLNGLLLPILIYGGLAVTLVWLGIGSIMARRWARALLVILSWGTLLLVAFVLIFFAFGWETFYASVQAAQPSGGALPASAKWQAFGFMCGFLVLFLGVPPAIGAFYYGSKSVKATCEALDPVERWTDRCPLPVLGLALFLAFGGVAMGATGLSTHGVIPFFGIFFTGISGYVAYVVMSLLWLYAAYGLYRLQNRAWWIAFLALTIFPISAFITYQQHDIFEFYRLAGYSDLQLEQIRKISFLNGASISWITVLSSVPWLIALLLVKRYFRFRA